MTDVIRVDGVVQALDCKEEPLHLVCGAERKMSASSVTSSLCVESAVRRTWIDVEFPYALDGEGRLEHQAVAPEQVLLRERVRLVVPPGQMAYQIVPVLNGDRSQEPRRVEVR